MIIWTIARATLGDAMRKKVLQIFLVVTIGLIIMSLSFSQTLSFSTREGSSSDLMMLKSFGLGLMAVAGLLISVVLGVSLIPQEIERRTIYTILAKPVKRYEFILGKYLGTILTLAVTIGIMGIVYVVTILIKAAGADDSTASAAAKAAGDLGGAAAQKMQLFDVNTVLGVLMIFLQFLVLSSVVMFFSVFLAPTVNFFMGTGVYLVGVMASVTETLGKAEGANPALKLFYAILYKALPNFDKFNVTNQLIHPEPIVDIGAYTMKVALYAIIYSLIMALGAVILFEKKEV